MIGTGAISHKHAQAYKNIGFELAVCTDIFEAAGRRFADQWGCEFVPTYEAVCRHPKVDYVDVCTFPDFRLQPLEICAEPKSSRNCPKPGLRHDRQTLRPRGCSDRPRGRKGARAGRDRDRAARPIR